MPPNALPETLQRLGRDGVAPYALVDADTVDAGLQRQLEKFGNLGGRLIGRRGDDQISRTACGLMADAVDGGDIGFQVAHRGGVGHQGHQNLDVAGHRIADVAGLADVFEPGFFGQ